MRVITPSPQPSLGLYATEDDRALSGYDFLGNILDDMNIVDPMDREEIDYNKMADRKPVAVAAAVGPTPIALGSTYAVAAAAAAAANNQTLLLQQDGTAPITITAEPPATAAVVVVQVGSSSSIGALPSVIPAGDDQTTVATPIVLLVEPEVPVVQVESSEETSVVVEPLAVSGFSVTAMADDSVSQPQEEVQAVTVEMLTAVPALLEQLLAAPVVDADLASNPAQDALPDVEVVTVPAVETVEMLPIVKDAVIEPQVVPVVEAAVDPVTEPAVAAVPAEEPAVPSVEADTTIVALVSDSPPPLASVDQAEVPPTVTPDVADVAAAVAAVAAVGEKIPAEPSVIVQDNEAPTISIPEPILSSSDAATASDPAAAETITPTTDDHKDDAAAAVAVVKEEAEEGHHDNNEHGNSEQDAMDTTTNDPTDTAIAIASVQEEWMDGGPQPSKLQPIEEVPTPEPSPGPVVRNVAEEDVAVVGVDGAQYANYKPENRKDDAAKDDAADGMEDEEADGDEDHTDEDHTDDDEQRPVTAEERERQRRQQALDLLDDAAATATAVTAATTSATTDTAEATTTSATATSAAVIPDNDEPPTRIVDADSPAPVNEEANL